MTTSATVGIHLRYDPPPRVTSFSDPDSRLAYTTIGTPDEPHIVVHGTRDQRIAFFERCIASIEADQHSTATA